MEQSDSANFFEELLDCHMEAGQLRLNDKDLTEISPTLLQARHILLILNFNCNKLSQLPSFIGEFFLLTQLHLDDNQLTFLPEELGCLTKLERLSLSRNALHSLPDSLVRCQALKHLDLSSNNFDQFPVVLCDLLEIETVVMKSNKMITLPTDIGRLKAIVLQLDQNQLESLPQEMAKCPRLNELSILENCLNEVTFKQALENVDCLNLSHNKLMQLPDIIGKFSALIFLYLDNNQLQFLPEGLGCLTKLNTLSAKGNALESLPDSLVGCISLKHLDLASNNFHKFPIVVCDLPEIETVDFKCNKISTLPPGIGRLEAKELIIDQNQLETLPLELLECPRLKRLYVKDNNRLHKNDFLKSIPKQSHISFHIFDDHHFGDMMNLLQLAGDDKFVERLTAKLKKNDDSGSVNTSSCSATPLSAEDSLKEHLDQATRSGVLHLSDNNLHTVPDTLLQVHETLLHLDLSRNKLSLLPSFIGQFISLKELHLDNNRFSFLPDELGILTKLEVLSVRENILLSLPSTLVDCISLKTLNLSSNKFSEFPEETCDLPNLEMLDLSCNKIKMLPNDSIERLMVMELNLNGNQLEISKNASDWQKLANCARLKILRVNDSVITDKDIKELSR